MVIEEKMKEYALQLTRRCVKHGAGEIFLNCINEDGTNIGFDIELINDIWNNVTIPVIASSSAGKVKHFSYSFKRPKPRLPRLQGLTQGGYVRLDSEEA